MLPRILLGGAFALAAVAPAPSQVLHTFGGPLSAERLGWSLAGPGDVNGDGRADVVLGVPFAPVGSVQIGQAEVRSGASGALLYTVDGDAALDHAGWAVAALGDLDGDGRGDFAVGLPDSDLAQTDGGAVRVVSGSSGTMIRQHLASAAGESYGYALASAGDVDGDGRQDVLIGAWRAASAGAETGRVEVRSGANGALIRSHVGAQAGDKFGIALAGLGDVDLDGRSDYAIGAEQDGARPGYVRVHSGMNGGLLKAHVGAAPGDAFGAALARLGDLDQDQRPDLAIGAPRALSAKGTVRVVSGFSGTVLRTLAGTQAGGEFGRALAGELDLDGDARPELIVGAPLDLGGLGAAYAVSTASGDVITSWPGQAGGDRQGQAVARVGDVDQDGAPDFAISAPREDLLALDGGVARVHSGAQLCVPNVYCAAKVNSLGCLPSVAWSGSPSWSGPDDFVVRAEQVVSKKPGVMLYGLAPAALPILGGTLCIAPPFKRSGALNSGGSAPPPSCTGVLALHLPQLLFQVEGWTPGTDVYVQFWSRDPAHPDGSGSSLSDALHFQVCP